MDKNVLFLQAIGKFLLGVIVIGLLLFLPAGSFQYWQAWLLMGILLVPMFCAGLVLMAKNPELLRKRLNAKEEEKVQKTVVKLSGLLFVAAFVVAGLNWRFGWCVVMPATRKAAMVRACMKSKLWKPLLWASVARCRAMA